MPFTISGVQVQFNIGTFDQLATAQGAKWGKSSLTQLRQLLQRAHPVATRTEVLNAINGLTADRKKKYKKALKYVLFHWPNMLAPGWQNAVADARIPGRLDFQGMYATMDQNTEYVDLMYGVAPARALQPYQLHNGRVRQADDFNNAGNIGTGIAFGRAWQGMGTLDASKKSVMRSIMQGVRDDELANHGDLTRQVRRAHAAGLLGTRYNPGLAVKAKKDQLGKDTHQSMNTMLGLNAQNQKRAEKHYWMHARFVKSVRMACKGGLAMVASSPLYTAVHAKVHFVLDKLGDMGAIARKDRIPGKTYVAITSSELCFCCRYWDDPDFPLSGVVKFYVNGERVYPPWDADWTMNDNEGNAVISNQEAWLRYRLCQTLTPRKPFPKFTQGQDAVDDDD